MITTRHGFFLAGLALAAACTAANGEIFDDWQFNDPQDFPLAFATNSGTTPSFWETSIGGSATTGDGAFRVQRDIGQTSVAATLVNNDYTIPDVAWMVVDIRGWALSPTFNINMARPNETLGFGFFHNPAGAWDFAQMRLERHASLDEVFFVGYAGVISAGGTAIPPIPAGFTAIEDRPIRIVLKIDQPAREYSIYYNIEEAGYVHVGTGVLPVDRSAQRIVFRALNGFADPVFPDDPSSPTEYVDVDRIFVTDVDPIGSNLIPGPSVPQPEQQVLQDWQFEDSPGTGLSDVVNNAGDGWWTLGNHEHDFELSATTTADGVLRIQNAGTEYAHAYITRQWTGKQWLVADFKSWTFTGTTDELIHVGFMHNFGISATNTADFRLTRSSSDPTMVLLGGRTTGLGAVNIADAPVFPAELTEPLRVVVEYDTGASTYAIYYRMGAGDYILFGESTTSGAERGGNAVRLFASNKGDSGAFIDLDRLFVTGENPMGAATAGYASWAAGFFPGGGPDAEAGADSDGDGVNNLLEYAFDGDPTVANRDVLPTTAMNGGFLQIEFNRNPEADDLTYVVEASSDLVSWTAVASATNGDPFVASGTSGIVVNGDTVTIGDSEAVTSNGRRFLRVEVTLATP